MPIYPYSFQLPPLNVQEIPNDGVAGEFLGINVSGALDWLPVAGGSGSGDMLKSENLSGLTSYPTARTNLGLGTTDSPTFKNLTISTGTITTSAPVTISQTWNAGAVAFTALKVNAVSTASDAASLLADFQVGGVSQFKITKGGAVTANSSLSVNGNVTLTSGAAWFSGYLNNFYASGSAIIANQGAYIGFAAANNQTSNGGDVTLYRDAANTLALRNGINPQTFNVYGTYTSGSVYERMFAKYDGTALAFQVGTQHLGATARPLQLLTDNTARMTIGTTGNVGIGTTAPGALLHVRATAIAGREDILKCTVSDAGNNAFYIYNGSGNSTVFAPAFSGAIFANTSNAALTFSAQTTAASDSGTAPLMYFQSRITDSETNPNNGTFSAVSTRPLFGWANLGTIHMQMSANGNLGIGTTAPSSKLHVAGTIKPEQATMVDKAAGFTLAAVDAGTIINSTSATAITINLPAADTATGYNVMIIQSGAGAVTIAANGNTLNSFGGAVITAGQHAACSIVRTAASTYNLSGNLV